MGCPTKVPTRPKFESEKFYQREARFAVNSEFEAIVREYVQKYGEKKVAVVAKRGCLSGFSASSAHRSCLKNANPELPEIFNEGMEIRIFGGVRSEICTHSLVHAQKALDDSAGGTRLFLIPSYFPWETKTQLPIIVREPEIETRIFLPQALSLKSESSNQDFALGDGAMRDIFVNVEKIIEKMRDGQCYLMNYTTKVDAHVWKKGFTLERFCASWCENPSRFGVFFRNDEHGVVSYSPERFLRSRNSWLTTEPIKGTCMVRDGEQPSLENAAELWNSTKEMCEHTMVVDLLRNDLNQVCKSGTVGVSDPFFVGIAGHLLQMQSTVFGRLAELKRPGSVLFKMLPAGSVTGTPKWRVCEITQELELTRRGYYTGVFGVLEPNGDFDSTLLIRTLSMEHQQYSIGVGAGITTLSNPRDEARECELKLASVVGRLL